MEKCGVRETGWLFFIIMISHLTLDGIRILTRSFAGGAFAAMALSVAVAFAIVFTVERLEKTSGGNLETLLGKKTYNVLSVVLFVITLFNAAGRMREFANPIGEMVLAQSPRVFILFITALAALAVSFTGPQAITRYSLIVSGAFFAVVAALVLTNVSGVKLINVYPPGGKNGFLNPFTGLYIFSDAVYFFFIKSWINNNSGTNYPVSKIVMTAGAVGVALTFFYCLAVPYPASQIYKYPFHRLSSLANSSVVFQRLDGLSYLIWIFFSFISSGALMLFALMIFSASPGVKNRNALCPAVVLICFLLSALKVDFVYMTRIIMTVFTFVILPSVVLWRKLGRRNNV